MATPKRKPARKRLTKLVIDRAKWGTGALRNTEGKMCCLGFAVEACGVKLRATTERFGKNWYGMPFELSKTRKAKLPAWLVVSPDGDYLPLQEIAQINDKTNKFTSLSNVEQEKLIARRFAEHGCKVTFVGER